ncbi:PREDICTED: uncharacterized protein LOC106918092 [Poecilia mexicana]|uniref:uncharacterized protein LOC106918092 n=1 Tax=Poecilia mexicana TaxID=48701 RepID=UPI00072E20DF|nr:PREDICTED: uncharacterized protein LOC106918092 [Poecilia mexicana]
MDHQSSLTDDPRPKDVKSDDQQADAKGELQTSDQTKDHIPSEDTPDGLACLNSADCVSAGEGDESATSESRSDQAHDANGQKSRRASSPGPHPVKTSCIAAHPSNPKLTLCLSNSPRKISGTPSDVDMVSPDSPSCDTVVNSLSDCCDGPVGCAEGSAKEPDIKSPQVVKDSHSGSLTQEKVCPVTTSTEEEDAEMGECSGSSDMSQDLIESQPDAISKSFQCNLDKAWLGTPIDELNRKPQCAPPLSHLKATPNHTVTVRVS